MKILGFGAKILRFYVFRLNFPPKIRNFSESMSLNFPPNFLDRIGGAGHVDNRGTSSMWDLSVKPIRN